MKRNLKLKKTNFLVIGILTFFIVTSVGYALFAETLTVNGTATAKGNFDVQFTSVSETPIESVGYQNPANMANAIIPSGKDGKVLVINVPVLEFPGAYVVFEAVVTNKGSIPAVLPNTDEAIKNSTSDPNVTVSILEEEKLKGQKLIQNQSQTIKIKVQWNEGSTAASTDVDIKIDLNYKQEVA